MVIPKVHINGTARSELIELRLVAKNAIEAAIAAVREAAPHSRDFYHTGGYPAARDEHNRRIDQLQTLATEFANEAIELSEQEGK